jgi:hypothetical protein
MQYFIRQAKIQKIKRGNAILYCRQAEKCKNDKNETNKYGI